jgi:hypothetical protein
MPTPPSRSATSSPEPYISATTNAASLFLEEPGNQLQDKKIYVGDQFVADAVNYVLRAATSA